MYNNLKPNDSAFAATRISVSLTKREYFAMNAESGRHTGWSNSVIEEIMGEKWPTSSKEEFHYWLRVEAKMKVMRADALIAELNNNGLPVINASQTTSNEEPKNI